MLLQLEWRRVLHDGTALPSFGDTEFSTFSQNGEDGILLYLFSLLGAGGRRVVEIGCGDGLECNAANLIVHHGWSGLLIDGDDVGLTRAREFYATRTNAWRFRRLPPTLVAAWVTRDNVDTLIQRHGFEGEIDLLSLDIDGMDYWIWQSLSIVRPRVVILEFNNRWSAAQSFTVPYADSFTVGEDGYFGASLTAFWKLGIEKGYRLVGVNSPNTNAFFLRDDIGVGLFPAVSVNACLASDFAQHQQRVDGARISSRPLVTV